MKKLMSLLFTLTLVIGVVFPITTVYANFDESDVVMTVNGNYYTSFESGWSKTFLLAGTGENVTVKLMADWSAPSGVFYVSDYRGYETGTKEGTLYFDVEGITIDLNGHAIDRNLPEGEEGCVMVVEGVTLTITDTSAEKNGKITGGYITDDDCGAGVHVNNGNLIINGGYIYGNSAKNGAGVYVVNSTLTVNGGGVSGNTASVVGGGVYLAGEGAELIMNGGEISHNIVEIYKYDEMQMFESQKGGGVYAEEESLITMNGGSINHNASNSGGGVYLTENSVMNFTGGNIENNTTTGKTQNGFFGGGICVNGGTLNMLGGTVNDNFARNGGGIYITEESSGKIIITGGKITGNAGQQWCGGIYHNSLQNLVIVDCEITDNDALYDHGGGVYVSQPADVYIGGTTKIINNNGYHQNPSFTADNLYLCNSESKLYNALGQAENVPNKPLEEGAEIGVDMSDEYFNADKYFIHKNSGFTKENAELFSSDYVGKKLYIDEESTESGMQYYLRLEKVEIDPEKYLVAKVTANGETKFYNNFNMAWEDAVAKSKESPATFTLLEDWVCGYDGHFYPYYKGFSSKEGYDYGTLNIYDDDIDLTIDLNGHKLDRNRKTPIGTGQVITIYGGTLRIKDSAGGGKITGANDYRDDSDTLFGGAIYAYDGNLYIEGGEISGNYTDYRGGGILWESDETLCITGGKIVNNYAVDGERGGIGGGIYLFDGGDVYIGGDVIIDDNFQADGKESNVHLADNDVVLKHAVGQAEGIPYAPLKDGAHIGIYAEDKEEMFTGDNSCFREEDFTYFYSDHERYFIRSVYDESEDTNAHQFYVTEWNSEDARYPRVKGVKVKDTSLLTDAVLNYNTQTITLTAHNTRLNFFEHLYLSDLIECTYDKDIYYLYDMYSVRDLRSEQTYKIMSDNGTYVLCTVKLVPEGGEWSDEQESVANPYKMTVSHGEITEGFYDFGEGWVYAVQQSQPVTVTLFADWDAPDGKFEYSNGTDDGSLYIGENNDITIDLNGNDIDRGLTAETDNGQVFLIEDGGKLTITDNSDSGNGKITGGYSDDDGGAFYVDYGSLYIKGGHITGNKAEYGGAIYLNNLDDAFVYITGGKIYGNTATEDGGAIYSNNGYLYFDGGEITENTAVNGGGVYWNSSDNSPYFTGGKIHGNTATEFGGGVYADYGSKLYFGGDIQITDNTYANVYLEDDEGNRTGINNSCGQDGSPNKPLTEGALIGIHSSIANDMVSGGNSYFNERDFTYFFSDHSQYYIRSEYNPGNVGHTYMFVFTAWSDDEARYPRVKDVTVKDANLLVDAVLDYKTQTITLTAHNTRLNFFEHVYLSDLIECTYDKDIYYLYGMGEIRDLREVQEYMIMSDNGTYVLCTVKLVPEGGEWSDEQESAANPYKMTVSHGEITEGFYDFGEGWVYAVQQSQPVTVTLFADWNAPNGKFEYSNGTDEGRLYVYGSNDITIDLNGNKLSRNLTSAASYGQVFLIEGGAKLTITDNSDMGDGKITGGYTDGDGGAIYIDYGKLYINGGEIVGNKATGDGGAIYGINEDDTFIYINGGKIKDNSAANEGGAIFMYNGYLYVDGGEITGNTATYGGGIYWDSRDILSLTGGTIYGNNATEGGGVYATDWGDMYIGGTIRVADNIKTGTSTKSNFYISDTDAYLNNAAGQSEVPNKPLTDGAYIGIYSNEVNFCLSDSNSRFNENSIKYLHADRSSNIVRAIYTRDAGNHAHQIYYNNISDVEFPVIKLFQSANQYVKPISLDSNSQTIRIMVDVECQNHYDFLNLSLSKLIRVTFSHGGVELVGFDEIRSFEAPEEYKITAPDGTYTYWTVELEWVCSQHEDKDNNLVCDHCGEALKAPEATTPIKITLSREDGIAPTSYGKIYVYNDSTKSVLVDTINLEDETTENSEVTVNASLLEGSYYIEIVKNGYLPFKKEISVSEGALSIGEIELVSGDIKGSFDDECGDGVIDVNDFIRVLRGFSSTASTELKKAVDVNEDGNISVSDLGLIKKNFGKTSDDVSK